MEQIINQKKTKMKIEKAKETEYKNTLKEIKDSLDPD